MKNFLFKGITAVKILGIVVIAFISVGLISGAIFLYNIKRTYADPYDQFLEMQAQALPYLDKLNEQTIQELPITPEGFSLLDKRTVGIENNPYYIGRKITLSFAGPPLEESLDRFYKYYETNLLNTGWELLKVDKNENRLFVSYRKEKSCLELSAYQIKPSQPQYFISIWQDFEHQPFVNNIPSSDVISFHLIDSWIIAKCP